MKKRTLSEINAAKKKLQSKMSDDHVYLKMLDQEVPKGGVYYNWVDEESEFRYRGSIKKLKKIVEYILNKHESDGRKSN